MKRYVYRNHEQCTAIRRREIRAPEVEDLSPRPEHEYSHVQFPVIPTMANYDMTRAMLYGADESLQGYSYVFECICFSTMIWVQEHTENDVSCGHYRIYNSYFQVPQGADLPETQLQNEGHMYHDDMTEPYRGLDGEAYYRHRMFELERRLRELEADRLILPREEIDDIHAGRAELNNKPIPSEYFDEEFFNVE